MATLNTIRAAVLSALLVGTLSAQAQALLSPAELRDDFRILRYTFEHAHGTLYRYTPKAEMDATFDAVSAQLDRSMKAVEFFRLLAPLLDRVHDLHTAIGSNRSVSYEMLVRAKVFPLDVRYVNGRAFVERNYSDNRAVPLGAEIVAINGTPMAEVTEKVLVARTADGYNRMPKYELANRIFWLYYYVMVGDPGRFDLDLRDPVTGSVQRFAVDGVPSVYMRPQFSTQTHEKNALEYVDEGRVAVMTIPSFGDLAMTGWFATSFRELKEKKVRALIIDIRDNGGGWDELNTELMTYLVPHPFRFYRRFTIRAKNWEDLRYADYTFDDFLNQPDLKRPVEEQKAIVANSTLAEVLERNMRTNPAAGIQQPKADVFDGDVYLLFNGGSASSGGEVPALFHFLGVGTLIGEEPNAAYQGTGGGVIPTMTLPHSELVVHFPLMGYENAVLPGVFEGHGVQPDFVIGESVEDAIGGCDTVMRFTLDLIASRR
jgi:hypothetical protein